MNNRQPRKKDIENPIAKAPVTSVRNDLTNRDISLAKAIRNGDADAFSSFYMGYADSVLRILKKMFDSTEDAEEIMQDTFALLWENRARFNPHTSLKGYVATMAKNLAIDLIRREDRYQRGKDELYYFQEQLSGLADEEIISNEIDILLKEVLRNMPPQRRKIFEMSREEGLTYNEIAEKLGLSYHTVHKHIDLAKQEIRKALALVLLLVLGM